MTTVTAFSFTNVTPPATPPDYFAGIDGQGHGVLGPNASAAVPIGKRSVTLRWDQTNIPADKTFAFSVDLHTSAGWQEVSNFAATGGPLPADSGGGFIATDQTTIPSGQYPDLVRVHVKNYGGWTLPTLAIEFD